jgi:hypothetical protein
MKDMARILTATYGVALAMMLFTYVTYASVKPAASHVTQTEQTFSWGDSFYNDGAAYAQTARK